MSHRSLRATAGAWACLASLLLAASPATGQTLEELVSAVRSVGGELQSAPPPKPDRLREILKSLDRAEGDVERWRGEREEQAGDSEAALEALYDSRDWLRLEHLEGEISYWRGWAYFHLAGQLEREPPEAVGAYRAAQRSFARAMRNLRDPAVAREMLLATAIAQRGAGSPAQSAETLARIERAFPEAPADYRDRVRLERARTALALASPAELLEVTRQADLTTATGRQLALLRLDWLLREPGGNRAELGAEARRLLVARGDAAAQAVARLEAAKLSSAELEALELGREGDALVGLALLREQRFADAAQRLERATQGSLDGLREDVMMARLAEAQLRSNQPEAAFATSQALRARYPRSSLRSEVARFGYAAAQRWHELEGSGEPAQRALAEAAEWVIQDAPQSEEAAEIRVRRALATASRSSPSRALRVLESLPKEAAGDEAVTLQRALLRSARLQSRIEEHLGLTGAIRSEASQLDGLLRKLPADDELTRRYRDEIRLARARARVGLGHAGALELLGRQGRNLEVERTRIVALWLGGHSAEALRAAAALLDGGTGSLRDRYALTLPVALAASEQNDGSLQAAPLRGLLAALRGAAPEGTEPEFLYELALREARAAAQAGQNDDAVALIETTLAQQPRARSNLILAAETLERGGRPDLATDVWHQLAAASEEGASDWVRARVGVARSLHATPGRAQDGCDVATSLLVSGRHFSTEAEQELRTLAESCGRAG